MKYKYDKIEKSKIPAGVRFDIPGRNQGQIVEIAYGGFSAGEHGEGDLYMRVHDQSIGGKDNPSAVEYFKLKSKSGAL